MGFDFIYVEALELKILQATDIGFWLCLTKTFTN